MKNRSRLLLLMGVLMLSLTMVAACSDDDDDNNPITPQTQDPPSFPLATEAGVELPGGLTAASDAQATMVSAYAAMANSFAGFTGFFAVPANKAAAAGAPWVYTWSLTSAPEVDLTFTLTIDETEDAYTWQYMIDGYDEDGTYDEVVFYEAYAMKDGSAGEMWVYDIDFSSTTPVLSWTWQESVLGSYMMEFVTYDESEPMRVVFGVDPDGSGDLNVYDRSGETWRILEYYEWTALGGGSYILYDYDGGEDVIGSWNPGTPM